MDPELVSKLYDFEWQQRNNLTSAVPIPVLGITAVGGAALTIAQSLRFHQTWAFWVPAVLLALAMLLLAAALAFVFASLVFPTYKKLASPVALYAAFEDLKKYYADHGDPDAARSAATEFNNGLRERSIEATHVNGTINQARGNRIRLAIILIVLALVLTAIASGFYVVDRITAAPSAQDVRIIAMPPH